MVLTDLLHKRRSYAEHDGERFLDAVQNARLITNAEQYYRIMYYGSRASWNLRDSHMFETLKTLLAFNGPKAKAIVWAHNSHCGDAAATEMTSRGEYNIGHLCRREFGGQCYTIGFGTNSGTVAAASNWDGQMEIKTVSPLFRRVTSDVAMRPIRLFLPQPASASPGKVSKLAKAASGACNRCYIPAGNRTRQPLLSAVLPDQFDEYIWFDKTKAIAVAPFETKETRGDARHLPIWTLSWQTLTAFHLARKNAPGKCEVHAMTCVIASESW